jgi:hypothetical protein
MDSDTENVVPPRRRDSVDDQISDLVRIADLAMHVWLSEQERVATEQHRQNICAFERWLILQGTIRGLSRTG